MPEAKRVSPKLRSGTLKARKVHIFEAACLPCPQELPPDRDGRNLASGRFEHRRLFMSGSARGFATGRLNVYQALLVRPNDRRQSGLPLTRADWYA